MKWMVDVNGSGGEAGETSMHQALKSLDFTEYIDAQGPLPQAVQQYAEASGYRITERGGGLGHWHVGVGFDDLDEAVIYLARMTHKFRPAIAASVLTVRLQTWSAASWKE